MHDLETSYTVNEHRQWHQPLLHCFNDDHSCYILLYENVAMLANDVTAIQRLGQA